VQLPADSENIHTGDIHMLLTTQVDRPCHVTCSGQLGGTFHWEDHGLKLRFPAKCSIEDINITIIAYLPIKSSNLPGLQFASAVFQFKTNVNTFKEYITLRMPHYIKIKSQNDCSRMRFVIENDDKNIELKHGDFAIGKPYGTLKIKKFCKIGIAKVSDNKGKHEGSEEVSQSNEDDDNTENQLHVPQEETLLQQQPLQLDENEHKNEENYPEVKQPKEEQQKYQDKATQTNLPGGSHQQDYSRVFTSENKSKQLLHSGKKF